MYGLRLCRGLSLEGSHLGYLPQKFGRGFFFFFGGGGIIFGLIRFSETPKKVKFPPTSAKIWGRRINGGFNSHRANKKGFWGVNNPIIWVFFHLGYLPRPTLLGAARRYCG